MHINTGFVCPRKSNANHYQQFVYAFSVTQVRVFQIEAVGLNALNIVFNLYLPIIKSLHVGNKQNK
jgi:hypothetical protein